MKRHNDAQGLSPTSDEARAARHDAGPKDKQANADSPEDFLVEQGRRFLDTPAATLPSNRQFQRFGPSEVTRGQPMRKACLACDAPGLHRHLCSFAYLVDVRGFPGETLSLFSGKVCARCAGRARANDEAWFNGLIERRRAGVCDRTLAAYLAISPTCEGVQ